MNTNIKRGLTGIALGLLFWVTFFHLQPITFTVTLLAILFYIIAYEWKNFFPLNTLPYCLLMPLYPTLPFALLISLNHSPEHRHLILILFVSVACFDTGSYIFGKFFGTYTIWPEISPGKTWQGFIGGYATTYISLNLLTHTSQPTTSILSLAFIISTLALCGDLFESFLKRRAGIKDSGSILPGHGGFLDRFDGILFTIFFFFACKDHLLSLF